jgi:hypothetical protein
MHTIPVSLTSSLMIQDSMDVTKNIPVQRGAHANSYDLITYQTSSWVDPKTTMSCHHLPALLMEKNLETH